MQNSDSIVRCFSFVESQLRQPRAPDAKSVTPFVTISRQTGSGAHYIGHELVSLLNSKEKNHAHHSWNLYDRDLVAKVIESHHLSSRVAAYMPEDTVNEFNSTLEEMMGIHPSSNELVNDTATTIRSLAKKGHCVLIGRGSHIITRGMKNGVHIRLVGSLEKRCARVAIEYGLLRSEAMEFIKREDKARARYLDYYYGVNINENTHYDLVINTDEVDCRTAIGLIATLLCERITMKN